MEENIILYKPDCLDESYTFVSQCLVESVKFNEFWNEQDQINTSVCFPGPAKEGRSAFFRAKLFQHVHSSKTEFIHVYD